MTSKSDSFSYYTRLLEAILFIAERPVSVKEIKQKLNIKEDEELNRLFGVLKKNLEKRRSFIQINEVDKGQSIQMILSQDKKRELDAFRIKKALSKDLMGTLAYIALKQPIKYGELKKVRGNKVKDHIEALEKEGFIKIENIGRTKLMTTTLYFASVFNLDPDNLEETLKKELKKRMINLID